MTTTHRHITVLLAALLLPLCAKAGSGDDFGTWTAINLKGNITEKLKAGFWFEMRTKDKCTSIDCFDILPSISYDVLPFLELGVGAELVDARAFKEIGFRPYATIHLASGPLEFSLREMPFIEIYTNAPTTFTLRSSVKITWAIPDTRITPYVNIELFTRSHWEKTRHYVGVDFGFGKRSSLDLFYMYYSFAGETAQRHLVGVTYNIKIR